MYINQASKTPCLKPAVSSQRLRFQGLTQPLETTAASEIALTPFVKFFLWLDKATQAKSSEVINILVTAFGTGIVAPFVIAFNQFNGEDKETKIYSALRQPISAVLAVLTQVGINMPVPKTLENWGRKGILGDHYLGPLYKIPPNAPASLVQDLEDKNKRLTVKYEKALQNPDYREKVAKLIHLDQKEAHDYDLRMAKKGRSLPPGALKIPKASEVTMEDALLYTGRRLGQLKYLTGFILSVITLYPTCVLLNWMYPRIMDALFPQLTAGDKSAQKPVAPLPAVQGAPFQPVTPLAPPPHPALRATLSPGGRGEIRDRLPSSIDRGCSPCPEWGNRR